MHRSLPLIALGLSLALLPSTASAATPQQTIKQLRSQLAASKKTVAKQATQISSLTEQRDSDRSGWETAKASLTATQAQLATVTADRDAQAAGLATSNAALVAAQASVANLQAANAGLQTAVNGNVGALNDPQLWSLLGAINQRMSALGGTAYTTSVFVGSSYQSYSFDWFSF
jgi:septal ring factor EnvC (AmiA/AmiB activator)